MRRGNPRGGVLRQRPINVRPQDVPRDPGQPLYGQNVFSGYALPLRHSAATQPERGGELDDAAPLARRLEDFGLVHRLQSLASLNDRPQAQRQENLDIALAEATTLGRMKDFGSRLRATLQAREMTQTTLGDRIGRSKGAVSQWIKGQTEPDLATLARLCDILNVSADFLVRGLPSVTYSPETRRLAERFDQSRPEMRRELLRIFGIESAEQQPPPTAGAAQRKPQKV